MIIIITVIIISAALVFIGVYLCVSNGTKGSVCLFFSYLCERVMMIVPFSVLPVQRSTPVLVLTACVCVCCGLRGREKSITKRWKCSKSSLSPVLSAKFQPQKLHISCFFGTFPCKNKNKKKQSQYTNVMALL